MTPPATSCHPASPSTTAAASRLVTGGLSLLIVLAFALAAGVPPGQLLATVSGSGGAALERAVAPQIVERQARRSQQERPLPAAHPITPRAAAGHSAESTAAARWGRPELRIRESLLALPPPAQH